MNLGFFGIRVCIFLRIYLIFRNFICILFRGVIRLGGEFVFKEKLDIRMNGRGMEI